MVIHLKDTHQFFILTNVYRPNKHKNRELFCDELKKVKDFIAAPWIVLGDFNITWSNNERMGAKSSMAKVTKFNQLIGKLELMELNATNVG